MQIAFLRSAQCTLAGGPSLSILFKDYTIGSVHLSKTGKRKESFNPTKDREPAKLLYETRASSSRAERSFYGKCKGIPKMYLLIHRMGKIRVIDPTATRFHRRKAKEKSSAREETSTMRFQDSVLAFRSCPRKRRSLLLGPATSYARVLKRRLLASANFATRSRNRLLKEKLRRNCHVSSDSR